MKTVQYLYHKQEGQRTAQLIDSTVPLEFSCQEEGSAAKESGLLCGAQLLLPMMCNHGDEQKEGHMM